MSGTTLLPWLLVGPTLLGVAAMVAYHATGIGALRVVAQAGLATALTVIALAVVASWRSSRRRTPPAA